jgi:hypothetical protein
MRKKERRMRERCRMKERDGIESVSDVSHRHHDTNTITTTDISQSALSPLLLYFALEYAIRKVQENQVGLKLNGTHKTYADGVNLLRDNIDTIKKNT